MDVSVVLGFVRCVVSMVIIGCYVVAPTILSCFLINGSESQSLEKRFGTEIVCFFWYQFRSAETLAAIDTKWT